MAKTIDYKRAREFSKDFLRLTKDVDDMQKYIERLKKNLINEVKVITTSGDVSKTIEDYITKGTDKFSNELRYKVLTKDLFCYKELSNINSECDFLIGPDYNRIKESITKLGVGKNPIAWLFASKGKKASAIEAYQYLEEFRNDSKYAETIGLIGSKGRVLETSFTSIEEDYINHKASYKNALKKVSKSIFQGEVRFFQSTSNQYSSITFDLERLKNIIEDSKKEVINSVNDLLASDALKILSGISVEEINRDKVGVKTKYLKDAGFQTLADVYTATEGELESAYGISYNKAIQIKQISKEYARELTKNIKIKLSVDNQDKYSTEVVKTIYKYIRFLPYEEEIKGLEENAGARIRESINKLNKIGNGIAWLFLSDINKSEYKDTYNYCKKLLSTEFEPEAKRLVGSFKSYKEEKASNIWKDFGEDPIKYYNIIESLCPGVLGNDDAVYGLPEELAREVHDECFFPDGLLCTLRKYQEWGVKYILHQERVLLGDEMGLGKTIQAIATMVSLKNVGATHFLVVCPASVISNWCREIPKHSKLHATKIHGVGRLSAFQSWIESGGVAVTTFETTGILNIPDNVRIAELIVDEAHYIKNPEAKRTKNTVELCKHSDRLLFMTGTALENNVDEMVWLIEVLKPNIAKQIENLKFMVSAKAFREKIAPVYYRRKREDVLTELPDLIESEEWCGMTPQEEKVYEACVLGKSFMETRRVSWNVSDLKYSSKANRLLELIAEAENDGRKILVFSYFLDTLKKIRQLLEDRCMPPITGSVPPEKRQQIIDEFDKAEPGTVLLAQINSGGTGLNIQSASVVIICEPQFKPSIENQAISRAYRMGQARNVLVYRLLCENSVDERLLALIKSKQQIFDTFADESVAAQKQVEVDEKAFGKIIESEIVRIKDKQKKAS